MNETPATQSDSTSIRAIDANSVHQITSGQVVIDLQTAVKELVENSLDAGATSIEVRFKNYGLKSVEVIDNGSGIAECDFESIGRKHHTSKLSSFEDLISISSFGFRGEAMSSLCAICESVTVTTAVAEKAPMGTVLELGKGGEVIKKAKAPRQRGTNVIITTPFVSLPVRRKELERNIKREFGKALTLLSAYALGPCCGLSAGTSEDEDTDGQSRVRGVRLVVTNQPEKGQKTTHISLPLPSPAGSRPSVRTGVTVLWGLKALDNVMDVHFEFQVPRITVKKLKKKQGTEDEEEEDTTFPIKVKGIISSPVPLPGSNPSSRFARTAADRQFFYVNGRPCTLAKIQKALNETYRSYTASNSAVPHFPLAIIDFNLPGDSVDVNVTPDKRTILVHAETQVIDGLRTSLEDLFSPTRSTYGVNAGQRSHSMKVPQTTQRSSSIAPTNTTPQRTCSMPVANNVSDEGDSDKELPSRNAAETAEGDRTACTPPPVSSFQPSAPLTSTRRSLSPNAPSDIEVDPRVTTLPTPTPLSPRAPNKPPSATPGSAIAATTTFGVEPAEYHSPLPPSPVSNPVSTGTGQGGAVDGDAGGRKQQKGESRREVVISTVGANWTQKVGLSVPKDDATGGGSSADQDSDHDELDDDNEPPRKKRKSVAPTAVASDEEVQVVGEKLAGESNKGSTAKARKPEASRQLKLTDAFQPRTARQGMRNRLAGFARSGSQMPPPIDDLEEEIEDHEMGTVGDNGGNTGNKSGLQPSPESAPLFLPDEDGDTAMEDAATSSSLAPATTASSLSASHPPTSSSVLPASSSSSVIDLTPDSDDEEIDGSVMLSVAPSLRSSGSNPDAMDRPEVIRIASSQVSGDVHLRCSLSDITDTWTKLREKLKHAKETSDLTRNPYGASKTLPAVKDGPMADHMVAEATLSRVIEKRDFGKMDILGQFNLGFIIVRKRGCGTIDGPTSSKAADPAGRDSQDDLFIVDQHAADEKYNFETLQQTHTIKSQKLLRPIALDLAASDEIVAVENLDVLERNGFELHVRDDGGGDDGDGHTSGDIDGERHGARISMTALPISKGTVFDMKDLEELIHLLSDKPRGQMVRCSKARAMFASRACRKSVMVGMPLTKGQMKTVIQHMGTMDQPWNCPHGRPTMRHLYDMSCKKLQHSKDVDWSTFA